MVRTIQQEAFLFSHDINKHVPEASERFTELMLLQSKDFLKPELLNEVMLLLKSQPRLLETFGRLFLPKKMTIEVWTNSKNESYGMFVKGDDMVKLGRLTGAQTVTAAASGEVAAAISRLVAKGGGVTKDSNKRRASGSAKLPTSVIARPDSEKKSQRKRTPKRKHDYEYQTPGGKKAFHPGVQEKDSSIEESFDDDQNSITSLDTHKTMDTYKSVDTHKSTDTRHSTSFPDDISTASTKSKRGRKKKIGQPRHFDMALDFINDLTATELKELARESQTPSSGRREVVLDKLVLYLGINSTMPFDALPLYVQKYSNGAN